MTVFKTCNWEIFGVVPVLWQDRVLSVQFGRWGWSVGATIFDVAVEGRSVWTLGRWPQMTNF